ncbi:MAG: DUF2339 domain-containing protein [Propionibacteriaceae bacterium]|nr:DUF2339 domain-containing protein [Propionibacteriaceae bacterium]
MELMNLVVLLLVFGITISIRSQLSTVGNRIEQLHRGQEWIAKRVGAWAPGAAATPAAAPESGWEAQPAAPPELAAEVDADLLPEPIRSAVTTARPATTTAAPPPPPPMPAPSKPAPQQLARPDHEQPSAQPQPAVRPQPPATPQPRPTGAAAAVQDSGMERLLGRNIVGIVASVLVFFGLIFLGYQVNQYITDEVRIAFMFGISAVLTGVGYWLNRRFNNHFTQALLGTGAGAFFISILVTHLVFHALGEIPAFSLLAAWTAACLILARHTDSLLIGILAHVGMVASVCAGYLGASDNMLMLLLVYQLVSSAIIVVGNVFCCRKMYRWGLFATMALLNFSSLIMWTRFSRDGVGFNTGTPIEMVIAAFITQFVVGTFLSYLIFVSCVRLKSAEAQGVLQVVNVGLWLGLLLNNLTQLVYKLGTDFWGNSYRAVPPAVGATLLCLFAVIIVAALGRRIMRFSQELETVTSAILGVAAAGTLGYNLYQQVAYRVEWPHLAWLVIVAAVFFMAGQISGNAALAWAGRIALAADAVFMMIPFHALRDGALAKSVLGNSVVGYASLSAYWTVFASLGYLAVLLSLQQLSWRAVPSQFRTRYQWQFRFIMFCLGELSLLSILTQSAQVPFGFPLWLLATAITLIVFHFLKKDVPVAVYRACEYLLALGITCACVWGEEDPLATAFRVAAAVLCFALFIERLRLVAAANALANRDPGAPRANQNIEYLTALAMTLLFTAVPEDLFAGFTTGFPLSLALMFIAMALVGLGFWSRCRPLRLYGLGLTIVAVLKLAIYDVWNADSIMRVIAFIGGGLICFGVSALYNFAEKHFEATPQITPQSSPLRSDTEQNTESSRT